MPSSIRNPFQGFASSVISVKDARGMAEKIVSQIMEYADVDFCAVYMKRQKTYVAACLRSDILLKLPQKINACSEFTSPLEERLEALQGEDAPRLQGIRIGLALPLVLKTALLGFIVLGPKKSGAFTAMETEVFVKACREFSLNLLLSYFEGYQQVTQDRYRLTLEKERLESASQISEAYRHELGNIINIISLASSGLEDDTGRRPSKRAVAAATKAIRHNVKRAQSIFNIITRYNEHAASGFRCRDAARIVEDALLDQRERFAKQKICLNSSLQRPLGVLANENLKEAFSCILRGSAGALEHFAPEKKYIAVDLRKEHGMVIARISDTGGDATSNAVYKGMSVERGKDGGLHYFIARKIIFDHRGTFKLASLQKGIGTVCTVCLPFCEDDTAEIDLFSDL